MSGYHRLGSDADVVQRVWSLGWVTTDQLHRLTGAHVRQVRIRVYPLVTRHILERRRFAGPTQVFGIGPNVAEVAQPLKDAWRPPIEQLQHTLLTVDLISALLHGALTIESWAGEPELRAWHLAGEPRPDAAVGWRWRRASGRFLVETDRGTESHQLWRSKLTGYAELDPADTVLVVTTTPDRARRIATAAHEAGVRLLAAVIDQMLAQPDPPVFDAAAHRLQPLTHACANQPGMAGADTARSAYADPGGG